MALQPPPAEEMEGNGPPEFHRDPFSCQDIYSLAVIDKVKCWMGSWLGGGGGGAMGSTS